MVPEKGLEMAFLIRTLSPLHATLANVDAGGTLTPC